MIDYAGIRTRSVFDFPVLTSQLPDQRIISAPLPTGQVCRVRLLARLRFGSPSGASWKETMRCFVEIISRLSVHFGPRKTEQSLQLGRGARY